MILNILKIKLPFVILLFLNSCINVGVEKYENKTISQKSSDCNLIINQESKKSLNTIVCQDGYKFEIPKFTYDEKSCRVEPYTFKQDKKLYQKFKLTCLDFRNKSYVQIF